MTNILGIAPYEGLKYLMDSLAQQKEDIQLTCFVGDYLEGKEILEQTDLTGYDVILSRGGTADLIQEIAPIPVLSIELSHYDVLNAIKLAQSYGGKFAIVGFPSVVKMASMLCDILQYQIPIFVTNNEKEVEQTIAQLQKQQFSLVLGDNMITRAAHRRGMHTVLITAGSASIENAFQQAVQIARYQQAVREENRYFRAAYQAQSRRLLVFQTNGELVFSNAPRSIKSAYIAAARKCIPAVLQSGRSRMIRRINKKSVSITGNSTFSSGEQLVVFELADVDAPLATKFPAMQMQSEDEVSDRYMRLFYSGESMAELRGKLDRYCRSQGVILLGEAGTGKDDAAGYLYRQGGFSSGVFSTISCARLTPEAFDNLFDGVDSPLFHKGNVLYLQDFDALSQEQCRRALEFFQAGGITSGNQLIFSLGGFSQGLETQERAGEVQRRLTCVQLELPPLRQRIRDIPALVALYLNELNIHSTTQIAGVEPEGITYLQSFQWPGNLRQLCRVLDTLAQITTAPYVRTEDVVAILKAEALPEPLPAPGGAAIRLDQTLDGIIADVIHVILQEEGMNRTKAAQRLGICRTTLWKYAKGQ